MSIPPSVITAKPRVHRKRKSGATSPTQALTLVSAHYDGDALTLTLVFSRAISLAHANPTQIGVYDGNYNGQYYNASSGTTVVNPTTVRFDLDDQDSWLSSDITLTASGTNGIVAADDGTAWAGVTGMVLTWP